MVAHCSAKAAATLGGVIQAQTGEAPSQDTTKSIITWQLKSAVTLAYQNQRSSNLTFERDGAKVRRPSTSHVRRAWRVTSQVRVLWPGIRRAEGKEKGKGVVARRGLEEAQSEAAGR